MGEAGHATPHGSIHGGGLRTVASDETRVRGCGGAGVAADADDVPAAKVEASRLSTKWGR